VLIVVGYAVSNVVVVLNTVVVAFEVPTNVL
jgi:hypothetical protein